MSITGSHSSSIDRGLARTKTSEDVCVLSEKLSALRNRTLEGLNIPDFAKIEHVALFNAILKEMEKQIGFADFSNQHETTESSGPTDI